ncbi:MAG: Crp/Fnr family transcriptional regulator [Acidobacteriota bacterium]|nr:Crp/Fnr family transcriptional regulator [Acidobacteriota bacterium]
MSACLNHRDARSNRLLVALPDEDYQRLLPNLEFVRLAHGEILHNSGDQMAYLYFPTTSIVSLLYTTENGATAEMGIVGRCGAVGIALFMGGITTPAQAVAQVAGSAFRIKVKTLQEEFARGGALQHLLLRYTQSLITQISQIAVCNRFHTLDRRLCRWLLFSHDCLMTDEMLLTQENISQLLGVRREAVTVAAGRLQDAGLISYVRGHIHVLDRKRLETSSCECYKVVTDEYERLITL